MSRKTFLLNSASTQVAFGIDFLLKVFVIRLLLASLGAEMLGIWGTLKAVAALPLFIQDALATAVFLKTARKKEFPSGNAMTASLISGAMIALLLFAMAPGFASFFRISKSLAPETTTLFRLSACAFFFSSISQLLISLLQGNGKFRLSAVLLAVASVSNSSADIIFLKAGYKLEALLIVDIATGICLTITAFAALRPMLEDRYFSFSWDAIKSLFQETGGQFVLQAAAKITWELDSILIPRFFGMMQMAPYWIGRRIPYTWKDVAWIGAVPVVPVTVETEKDSLLNLERIYRLFVAIIPPIAALLFYFSPDITRIWVGNELILASSWMRILVLAVAIDLIPATLFYFLLGRGVRRTIAISLISTGVKISLAIVACSQKSLEMLLLSTTACALVFAVLTIFETARQTGKSPLSYIRPLLPSILSTAITIAAFHFVSRPQSLLGLVIQCFFFAALSLMLCFVLMRILQCGHPIWDPARRPR